MAKKSKKLPNRDAVTKEADKDSNRMKYGNDMMTSSYFEGFISGAEWMRKKAESRKKK